MPLATCPQTRTKIWCPFAGLWLRGFGKKEVIVITGDLVILVIGTRITYFLCGCASALIRLMWLTKFFEAFTYLGSFHIFSCIQNSKIRKVTAEISKVSRFCKEVNRYLKLCFQRKTFPLANFYLALFSIQHGCITNRILL